MADNTQYPNISSVYKTMPTDGLELDDDLAEYYAAVSGDGPHARNWSDKPHRLIYDLVRLCQEARQ